MKFNMIHKFGMEYLSFENLQNTIESGFGRNQWLFHPESYVMAFSISLLVHITCKSMSIYLKITIADVLIG